MGDPAVSVLIPTYNRAGFIGECIRSLLTQTLVPSQILVIDDGSTDSTAHVLQSFGRHIQVIHTPQVGKSSALNAGLRQTSGEYAWIFDDDDVALPDALQRFVQPLEAEPTCGFSYSQYWYTPTLEDGRLGEPTAVSYIPDVWAGIPRAAA